MNKVVKAIRHVHGTEFSYGPSSIMICKCILFLYILRHKAACFSKQHLLDVICSCYPSDPTSGDATDWTYGVLGVTHSYGVELRPGLMDLYGFTLPPSFIVPVGKETYHGIKALSSLL